MENRAETGAAETAAPEVQQTEKPAAVTAPAPRAPAYTVDNEGRRVRKLVKPIIGHQGPIETITLRKPNYRDIMTNGDPESLVVLQGGYVPQVDMVTIERYIIALSGVDQLLLEQLDYLDALALRDAVRSFFQ